MSILTLVVYVAGYTVEYTTSSNGFVAVMLLYIGSTIAGVGSKLK